MDFIKLLGEWSGLIAILVVGGFAFYGNFDKTKKAKIEETNKADDRLVGLLQGTVDQLTLRLENAEATIKENQKELVTMKAENLLMKNIFQGRDEQTLKFQAEGFAAMAQMPAMVSLVKANSDQIANVNKNVERLYTLMEGYLEQLALGKTVTTEETTTKKITNPATLTK